MINNSNELANSLLNYGNKSDATFRMAKVTAYSDNKVFLTFYGEENQREKAYKRLSSYYPQIGDTVICAKLNGSYTILGKVV